MRILSYCYVDLVAVPADKWVLAFVFIRHFYIILHIRAIFVSGSPKNANNEELMDEHAALHSIRI